MRRRIFLAGCAGIAASCAKPSDEIMGGPVRLAREFDDVIDPDAKVEQIGAGFEWAEGPLWVRDGGYLLFTDVPGNVIRRWSRAEGVREFMRPSGFTGADSSHLRESGANGLALDASGALIMCDSGNRTLARVDLVTRRKEIICERFGALRFNSPNDLAITRGGAIYFTDPPYGLAGVQNSPIRELPFSGVFLRSPGGIVHLIDDTLSAPNGIALSANERTLYVSNSDRSSPIIRAYALGANGMAISSRTFFDVSPLVAADAPGLPDGMKLDAAGRLFVTGPGGVMVLSPDGDLLGSIRVNGRVANCAFGEDGRTLFLTAHDKLARVRVRTRGAEWA